MQRTRILHFAGLLINGASFGAQVFDQADYVTGVQLNLQTASAGNNVIIRILDAGGNQIGTDVQITAGEKTTTVSFASAVPIIAGTVLHGYIVQNGTVGTQYGGRELDAILLTTGTVVQLFRRQEPPDEHKGRQPF